MEKWNKFEKYLVEQRCIKFEFVKYYIGWIKKYIDYCDKGKIKLNRGSITDFLLELGHNYEEWQVKQAHEAVKNYIYYLSTEVKNSVATASYDMEWQKLADEVKKVIRLKHLAYSTEQTYLNWLRRFYKFLDGK